MISKDKEYVTRNGREVRIYATDGADPFPVHGAIEYPEGFFHSKWLASGKFHKDIKHENDLLEKPKTHEVTVYFHRIRSTGYIVPTDSTIDPAGTDLIAERTITLTEGEGLNDDTRGTRIEGDGRVRRGGDPIIR